LLFFNIIITFLIHKIYKCFDSYCKCFVLKYFLNIFDFEN
jgi:hypothetical protein